jgi:hypothetical protein
MKIFLITACLGLACLSPVLAQFDIPGNPMVAPKKSAMRPVGGGVNTGTVVEPAKSGVPKVRYTAHIVLHASRMWSNTEGKPLEAGLLAFEDLVSEVPQGSAQPVMPAPPANPTLIRDGKIRLLVKQKPVEVALDRLSQADREFIDQMKAALAKKVAVK